MRTTLLSLSPMKLTRLFNHFISSEKTGGIILLFCTLLSLLIANSSVGQQYVDLWHLGFLDKPLEFWINDGLMTIFFLLVGLEIERELYIGELAHPKKSLLPILAALGGMIVPAIIHLVFNFGLETQRGFGIPMATDIAFSLAILSLLGKRVPVQLKVFLTALAIIDDLGAIVLIALFYSKNFSLFYFGLAAALFLAMFVLNRLKIYLVWIYLTLGVVMWFCMHRSGIHATITGVLLSFVIPFGKGDEESVSYKLQHRLHLPVAFIILPLFALVNTAIIIPAGAASQVFSQNSLGVLCGLMFGKPLGVFLFSIGGIAAGWCVLPGQLKKRDLFWTGLIAGVGFTMSIFITLLAFDDKDTITSTKIAIIIGSFLSALLGYLGLRFSLRNTKTN